MSKKKTHTDNDLIMFSLGKQRGSVYQISRLSQLSEADVLAASKDDITIELTEESRKCLLSFIAHNED